MGKKSLHLLALFCLLICYCIPQQISSGTSSHKPYLVFIRYDIIKIRWYGVCADQLFPVIIHLWQMVTSYFSVPCKPFVLMFISCIVNNFTIDGLPSTLCEVSLCGELDFLELKILRDSKFNRMSFSFDTFTCAAWRKINLFSQVS